MNRKYNVAPHAISIVKMDRSDCHCMHMSTPTPHNAYVTSHQVLGLWPLCKNDTAMDTYMFPLQFQFQFQLQ